VNLDKQKVHYSNLS